MKEICTIPFNHIEISWNGNIFTCCPMYINYKKIANLLDENITSVNDIWNSPVACELRKKILDNDYSLCNLDICRAKKIEENSQNYTITPPLPEFVTLSYDKECNIKCITCRDEIIKNSKEQVDIYNKKILTTIIPLLENAKIICINGLGEALYSKHSRLLLKEITKKNKHAKFEIYTNGILFNEKNCKELGLENRIERACFSIHAFEEELYKKIMIGSNQKVVLKNLNWAAEQQKSGEIKEVTINTVISGLNYIEIPKLIKLARDLNIHISFSTYVPWGTAKLDEQYDELSIWEKTNPNYKHFVEILNEAKELNYAKCAFPPAFPI